MSERMSDAEYQARTLEETGDDLVVGGVAYNRAEWEPDAEDGVRRREDFPGREKIARRRELPVEDFGDNPPF